MNKQFVLFIFRLVFGTSIFCPLCILYIGFWFHKAFSFQFFVYIAMQNIGKLSIYYAYYNEECISNLFCLYSSCFWEFLGT
jgi:hypothetical protein